MSGVLFYPTILSFFEHSVYFLTYIPDVWVVLSDIQSTVAYDKYSKVRASNIEHSTLGLQANIRTSNIECSALGFD
jgi:hypothetical protein